MSVKAGPTLCAIALSLWVALALCAATPARSDPVTADYTRTPVLMVHGWFIIGSAGPATWATMKKNLVADGWPEEYLWAPSFKYVQGCDPDHAEEIDAWVDELLDRTGADQVDILAHSQGALNAMYYLRKMCGVHRIRKMVSLAGAYHGTVTACLAPFSCGTKEMCIGSKEEAWKENEILADLMTGDETPGDTLYSCVWTKYDEIIIPAIGGTLQGAQNIQCETPFLEHGGILMSDESYGYVKEALLDGGLNEDGPGWEFIPDCMPIAPYEPPFVEPLPEPVPDSAHGPQPESLPDVALETASDPPPVPDAAADDVPEAPAETIHEDAGKTDVWTHLPARDLGACTAGGGSRHGPTVVFLLLLLCSGLWTKRLTRS